MKNAAALLANPNISLLFATSCWTSLLYCINHKVFTITFKTHYDWSFLPITSHQVFRGLQSSYSDSSHHLLVNLLDRHLYAFCQVKRWHIQKGNFWFTFIYSLRSLLSYVNKENIMLYEKRYLTCWSRILNCLPHNLPVSTFVLFWSHELFTLLDKALELCGLWKKYAGLTLRLRKSTSQTYRIHYSFSSRWI